MGNFYEIIKSLKIPEDKKEPKKKRVFKIRFPILLLSLLFLMFASGLGLLLLNSYIKSSLKPKTESKIPQISQVQINKVESLPSKATAKENQKIATGRSTFFKNIPIKSIARKNVSIRKNESFQTSMAPDLTDKKEPPLEGFLLTKEDLLNNLLLLAEEERTKGNCRLAIFYYQNYLKEKENPLVMNNLGACFIETGQFDEAINVFSKALSLKNDPEIKYNLIVTFFKKGDKEKACKELKNSDTNPFLEERIKKLKSLCEEN